MKLQYKLLLSRLRESWMSALPYELRYSKIAKYLQIRISYRGLELIIPSRKKYSQAEITTFLASKEAWIAKNWPKYFHESQSTPSLSIPNLITLKAVSENWQVQCVKTNAKTIQILSNPAQVLNLTGAVDDHQMCLKKLQQWLAHRAKAVLGTHLQQLATLYGFSYQKFTLRHNYTRWGSCTREKHISLCCKLLFIDKSLMQHVILHELCHTKIMNHGKLFWRSLEKIDSNAKQHAKALNNAARDIPLWMRKKIK